MGIHNVVATGPSPVPITITIANGASLSSAIDLGTLVAVGARMAAIQMPSAWTAANLTFQVSLDGVTYADFYDSSGTEYSVTASTSRTILVPYADFFCARFLKVRSGTTGTPVNQGADRSLILNVVG